MKNFVKYGVIVGVVIFGIILVYDFWFVNICPIKHIVTVNELKDYQKSLDPDLCDNLLKKIIELNEKCGIEIEPVDCG